MSRARTKDRKVYGSHVSRVLAAAGFSRGNRRTTGYRAHGETQSFEHGYLPEPDSGCVTVEHLTPGALGHADQQGEAVEQYAAALEAAGFHVETRTRGSTRRPFVVVLDRDR